MDKNVQFIQENYIEQVDLCSQSNISKEELYTLIDKELIPEASFEIELNTQIRSPLGDEVNIQNTQYYYSKNVLQLINQNKTLENSTSFKEQFKAKFIHALLDNPNKDFAYGNILNQEGSFISDKLKRAFEEEWDYYCKGIYGICTLNASPEDIAKKEIAVKKLIAFNEKHQGSILAESDKEQLIELNNEYNEISNLFAPYQRDGSSRGKYLDTILTKNSMDNLIKRY